MICAPSEDSDQPGHPPSLTRVFAVRMKKPWPIEHPAKTDAQADMSLSFAHKSVCWFCHAAAQIKMLVEFGQS